MAVWRSTSDHPAAAGHFPGNPIVPGALLLDIVVDLVAENDARAIEIKAAKFLAPVRPGEPVAVRWRAGRADERLFECRAPGERLVLTGSLRVQVP